MKLYKGENRTYTQSKISRDFPAISPVGIEDEIVPQSPRLPLERMNELAVWRGMIFISRMNVDGSWMDE
jgi:hypothetical protein